MVCEKLKKITRVASTALFKKVRYETTRPEKGRKGLKASVNNPQASVNPRTEIAATGLQQEV
jgi:hypothetical protein